LGVRTIISKTVVLFLIGTLFAAFFPGCKSGTEKISAKEISEGRRLYLSYGCAACHGTEGRGDGPAAISLKVKPRDFRQHEKFRNGRSVEAISRTIAEGVPRSQMPASPFIEENNRKLMAEYIRSLNPERTGNRSGKE
jgi:high-affinity iron transporter